MIPVGCSGFRGTRHVVGLVSLYSENSYPRYTTARIREIAQFPGEKRPPRPVRTGKPWHRLSQAACQEIAERYIAGETSTALAKDFGVARSTVLKALHTAGVEMRRQPMTSAQVAAATRLYESGLSLSQVTARIGVHQDTIREAFKKTGVELRPKTGGIKHDPQNDIDA